MLVLGAWHRLEQALPAMRCPIVHAVDGTV